ncbi:porin [Comamonas sp. GB3 AK4-5]|uniref:porin n=1 Tax=Comamonas sp. GB3 AK4-5 TaxID=3231487 RepID=UPI00351E2481
MNKRQLLATAVVAMADGAAAQSNLTIYGAVDTSVVHLSIPGKSVAGLACCGRSGSKLGIRGREDLGNGYRLNLWLEGGVKSDGSSTSAFEFSGHSSIGLQGGFGELRVGRDANILSQLRDDFSPTGGSGIMGLNGNNQLSGTTVGSITGSSSWTSPNSITYLSPKLGKVYARASYSFGEQAGNNRLGSNISARVGYSNGPLHLSLGYNLARGGTNSLGVSYRTYNLGVSYWIRGFMPMLLLGSERGNSQRVDLYSLGIKYRWATHELRGVYTSFMNKVQDRADSQRLVLGYSYIFSKRTEIFSSVARLKNQKNAARKLATMLSHSVGAGQSISGYEIGIYHRF